MTAPDTTYVVHGATLALAWFALINALVSALVALAVAGDADAHPTGRAGFWFALRLLPASSALVFVGALFLPSYWKYEPRDAVEGVDITLAALACAGTAILVWAGARGASAWWQASRRVRLWMRSARVLASAASGAAPIPAFEIDGPAPTMSLAGIARPRLFITRALLNTLTDEELEASVAHEVGHWRARDNVKRLAMRSAPDLLSLTPAARRIERWWVSAAEHSADRVGGGVNPAARCALASALVKAARLMPDAAPTGEPITTLLGGGEIASRVERLLDDRAEADDRSRAPARRAPLAAACLAALASAYGPLLRLVHDATEILVRSLP